MTSNTETVYNYHLFEVDKPEAPVGRFNYFEVDWFTAMQKVLSERTLWKRTFIFVCKRGFVEERILQAVRAETISKLVLVELDTKKSHLIKPKPFLPIETIDGVCKVGKMRGEIIHSHNERGEIIQPSDQ